jgi:hypothetical protein
MGAIGVALMAKRAGLSSTQFKGRQLLDHDYQTKTRIADGCANHCELTMLYQNGEYVGCIGNKCSKCDVAIQQADRKMSLCA